MKRRNEGSLGSLEDLVTHIEQEARVSIKEGPKTRVGARKRVQSTSGLFGL